jgi:hypothetical protein
VVGIYTNDAEAYPEDRPQRLAEQARQTLAEPGLDGLGA